MRSDIMESQCQSQLEIFEKQEASNNENVWVSPSTLMETGPCNRCSYTCSLQEGKSMQRTKLANSLSVVSNVPHNGARL